MTAASATMPTTGTALVWKEAQRFLRQSHLEERWAGLGARLEEVRAELEGSGRYQLSPRELEYGARLAWRNSTRCVGRAYWRALKVRDLRHLSEPQAVFEELLEHLRVSERGGNVLPTISVFAPGVRVLNDQLIRYAGYRQPDGSVLGDPKNLVLTERLLGLGWSVGPGTPFDVLPLAIRSGARLELFELPPEVVREVFIGHPSQPEVPDLVWRKAGRTGDCPPEWKLRWHALPAISDLCLEIGGQRFSCAPFSGWYLETEIGARNLADPERYDLLPTLARGMGLDMRSERTLWRDRALVELNVAVLTSFDAARVRLSDHHAVTRHFVRFEQQEARAGRRVFGRWSWLVPPLSPATTPVYHRRYTDQELTPNFFPQPDAPGDRSVAGPSCPFH